MFNHLATDIKRFFPHYLVLLFILVFGTFAFLQFQRLPQLQILSLFTTAAFYIFWGIIHHYLEGDLHLRVILEYLAVSLLGFLIVYSLILRA